MRADLLIVVLHVAANMVWVGALLASVIVTLSGGGPTPEQARLGLSVFRRLAIPGFVLSLAFGAVRLGIDWRYYMVATHFMHAKLALAFAAIVAHHWIGARLQRLCEAKPAADRSLGMLALAFGLACLGSIALVVLKPF